MLPRRYLQMKLTISTDINHSYIGILHFASVIIVVKWFHLNLLSHPRAFQYRIGSVSSFGVGNLISQLVLCLLWHFIATFTVIVLVWSYSRNYAIFNSDSFIILPGKP